MAKKKDRNALLAFLPLLLVVVAVVLLVVMDVVAIHLSEEDVEMFNGLQVIFGHKTVESKPILGEVTTEYFAFSIMGLLAVVAVVAGAILSAANNKLFNLIGAVAIIVGAVMIFMMPNFVVLAEVEEATLTHFDVSLLYEDAERTLATGGIISAICAGLGGLVGLYNVVKN